MLKYRNENDIIISSWYNLTPQHIKTYSEAIYNIQTKFTKNLLTTSITSLCNFDEEYSITNYMNILQLMNDNVNIIYNEIMSTTNYGLIKKYINGKPMMYSKSELEVILMSMSESSKYDIKRICHNCITKNNLQSFNDFSKDIITEYELAFKIWSKIIISCI